MNERIKQLAEQAIVSVDIVTGNEALDDELAKMYIPDCFAEKFAELIVRECIDIASQEDFDVMMKEGYPCSQTAKKIKQHFGVEE